MFTVECVDASEAWSLKLEAAAKHSFFHLTALCRMPDSDGTKTGRGVGALLSFHPACIIFEKSRRRSRRVANRPNLHRLSIRRGHVQHIVTELRTQSGLVPPRRMSFRRPSLPYLAIPWMLCPMNLGHQKNRVGGRCMERQEQL